MPSLPLVAASAVLLVVLVLVARLMTGPAPEAPTKRSHEAPPPLVLTADTPTDSPLAAAAALLGEGRTASARERFVQLVAEEPGAVAPQVGLALSAWKSMGPARVVRDLEQLAREYPDDPYVSFHLGLAQVFAGERQAGAMTLRRSRNVARSDPERLGLARRADDVLHPALAPGYPPLLVSPSDCRVPSCRGVVAKLRLAVQRQDRLTAGAQAQVATRVDDPAAHVAAAIASYDKDDPAEAQGRLAALADAHRGEPVVAFHHALVLLWNGDRSGGTTVLRAVRDTPHAGRWSRQAAAVLARLE